jgi:hypothetical protein
MRGIRSRLEPEGVSRLCDVALGQSTNFVPALAFLLAPGADAVRVSGSFKIPAPAARPDEIALAINAKGW